MKAPESMVKLIEQLRKLPGVGPKTAGRMALHILQMDPETVAGLAEAMVNAKELIRPCPVCFNYTDEDLCWVCKDESRDKSTICVVEGAEGVLALERMGEYRGLYQIGRAHV